MQAKAQQKESPVAVSDKPQTTKLWDRLTRAPGTLVRWQEGVQSMPCQHGEVMSF